MKFGKVIIFVIPVVLLTCSLFRPDNAVLVKSKSVTGNNGFTIDYGYEYNDQGNLIRKYSSDSDGSISEVTYTYDENGNCLTESYIDNDSYHYEISYEYDQEGYLIRQSYQGSDNYQPVTTYEYDESGNLIRERMQSNFGPDSITEYFYTNHLCICEKLENDYGDWIITSNFYHPNGNLFYENVIIGQEYESILTHSYNRDGLLVMSYEVDSEGLWEKTLLYYDTNRSVISEKMTNAEGIYFSVIYKYF